MFTIKLCLPNKFGLENMFGRKQTESNMFDCQRYFLPLPERLRCPHTLNYHVLSRARDSVFLVGFWFQVRIYIYHFRLESKSQQFSNKRLGLRNPSLQKKDSDSSLIEIPIKFFSKFEFSMKNYPRKVYFVAILINV